MIYQGIRLPKNDQGYCDPTTRTQATTVWSRLQKTIKVIVTPQQDPKQQLFGFRKTHVQHFK